MKSRITIEVDFDNGNQPIIQILKTNSDDVRDKLVQSFTEQVGCSSWLQIKWVGGCTSAEPNSPMFERIHISPIKPENLKEQGEIMIKQAELNAI
jgi:hypothetical protein